MPNFENAILSSLYVDSLIQNARDYLEKSTMSSRWMIEYPVLKNYSLSDYIENDAINVRKKESFLRDDTLKLEGIEIDSTNDTSINKNNEEFLCSLREQEGDFVISLERTDFEDGYNNPILDFIEKNICQNRYMTFLWLYEVYSRHRENERIIAGLLRIVECKTTVEDIDTFFPLVELGIKNANPMCQEAAIMTIETWRDKQCLELLESSHLSSPLMQQYANIVISELKKELV